MLKITLFLVLGFIGLSAQADGESAANRNSNHFTLTGQVIGVGPLSTVSTGARLGLIMDSYNVLELVYHSSSTNLISVSPTSSYSIPWSSIGLRFKHFLGNSFYTSFGAEHRELKYAYYSRFNDGTLEEDTKFEGNNNSVTFTIGNNWQWSHFTMGCDWFGASFPVTSEIKSESSVGTFSSNVRRLSDDEQRYLKDTNLFFVQLYLGASF